ncbi:DNA resolvase [Gluconobacter japonicus]|uniref:recombinase family protein n=1 Tax=Gluconobacter japonicus TaxID=376620 RepID=UPI00078546E8|nr:recombinase family protein [Gluconobacter japonicus]KXV23535.1 DNA resolvase [Gluconobacter japonicus]KXV41027.1 DNA resolvase [Gluconobacter japonicus]
MTRYGYARVSTGDQVCDGQVAALQKEGVTDIVFDTVSGSVPAASRPGLSSLLSRLKEGDSLVVACLDRLGRNTLDVMGLVSNLTERRVRVRILNIGIETGTPNGQLFLTILAGFAQFERELIRERTRAGLAAIRLAGKQLGRPPVLTVRQKKHVKELSASGRSLGEIAGIFRVSRTTVWRTVHCGLHCSNTRS